MYLCALYGSENKQRLFHCTALTDFRPSVRMEQLGSHWTDFHDIDIWGMFRKSVEKMQV